MMRMTVKLIKVSQSKWDVQVGKDIIGQCNLSYKHGGSYQMRLPNGVTVNAVNQKAFKSMVAKELGKGGR
jgi:hypothetical protein